MSDLGDIVVLDISALVEEGVPLGPDQPLLVEAARLARECHDELGVTRKTLAPLLEILDQAVIYGLDVGDELEPRQ